MRRLLLALLSVVSFWGVAVRGGLESVAVMVPGEKGEEWIGGETDPAVHLVGEASVRWRHATTGGLRLANCPADWTAGSAIRLRVHSEVATGSSFMLIFESQNPDTEGMDYWMHRVVLDFTGWKEIVLPRRALGAARTPLGWDRIGNVILTATGWEQTPDPRAVVHIDQMELVDIVGPRTTDQELFAALDLSRPELAAVQTAAAKEDWPAAVAALAAYYRERRSVPWYYDPHQIDRTVGYSKGAAEETVEGKVTVVYVPHQFPDGKFDWFYNPTIARPELPVNHEWQWQLGRMGYWPNLGRAYWATGDERYAQTFVQQLRSWARDCVRPDDSGNGAGSAWRTIECGIRMGGTWPDAWHRFLHSPSFTDADLALFLKVCHEHAIHLVNHRTTGNWLTMEMSGLYTIGAVYPEFRDAAAWRELATQALYQELTTQFLPDGAQIELTTGYHQVALDNVLKIPRTAQLVGRLDEMPADYITKAEGAFGFNLKMMTPERDLPHVNDAWHVGVAGSLRAGFELFPRRTDFQWIATDGKEGTVPDFTSVLLPYAGFAVMRSDWSREANYLAFDGALLGYGHYHQDKLNVILHAYGREMLYDGGGGNYESSKWRRYSVDTFSHSTVLVDGLPQRRGGKDRWAGVARGPLPIVWRSGSVFDYAAASYDEPYGSPENHPASQRREVLFLKPDLFLVVDRLVSTDGKEHRYEARWQVNSTTLQPGATPGSFVSTDAGKPNLAIVPLLPDGLACRAVSTQEEPELLGWLVHKDSRHIPTTTVCHQRQGGGTQTLITLLLPLRPDAASPVLAVRRAGDESVVEIGGRSLHVRLTDAGIAVRETGPAGETLRAVCTDAQ